jgi:hypothetical protein
VRVIGGVDPGPREADSRYGTRVSVGLIEGTETRGRVRGEARSAACTIREKVGGKV